jgi:intracellular sulfur oxidation DsrE/DsrF family protein
MRFILSTCLLLLTCLPVHAAENAPWGSDNFKEVTYKPQRVVYDVSARNVERFENVLDRASYLSKLYRADPFATSIVLVMHGDEIPFFAIKNYKKYKDLMIRAQSLTHTDVIKFKMCKVAAQGYGLEPKDIHGFVEIVPMADAEIIRLQREDGHAYMQ